MNFSREIHKVVEAHNEAPIIHPDKRHLGIILTMAGYIFYAMYTVFFQVEAFRNHALDSPYAIFFELMVLHFVMFATYFVFCIAQGKNYFKCNKLKYVLLRGVFAIAVLVFYSLARVWTTNVDNSILYSTDAFWLVLFLFLLGIPLPKGVWIGVVIGTAGIIFVYSFDFSSIHDVVGGIFGTISGVLLALVIFLTRYMVRRDPPLRIGFYNSLLGLLFFGSGTIYFGFTDGWEFPKISSMSVMIISGFIWALALFFFLEAFYFAENHVIGAIALFLPIFTETFNWAINKEILSWTTFTGSLITGIGGLIVIIASYRHDAKNTHKKFKQFKFPELVENEEDED